MAFPSHSLHWRDSRDRSLAAAEMEHIKNINRPHFSARLGCPFAADGADGVTRGASQARRASLFGQVNRECRVRGRLRGRMRVDAWPRGKPVYFSEANKSQGRVWLSGAPLWLFLSFE